MAWGYHLMLDCYAGDLASITDGKHIADFATTLVDRIDMKAYGDPQVIHFGEDDKMGFTLVQLIETSNICAHFSEDTGNFYLDVFSCKPYDINVVKQLVDEYFLPQKIVERYIERE
jgi:S-adenosylmethionine/arginine decarboxylase-like enzyme